MNQTLLADIDALISGIHRDPFAVLGPHIQDGRTIIRAFVPGAERLELMTGDKTAEMTRVHDDGLFIADDPGQPYHLCCHRGQDRWEFDDPYRFAPLIGELDEYFLSEGSHLKLYERLGAHLIEHQSVQGCHFAVWAPNASRVAVVGDFNFWDDRVHGMRHHPATGIFEIFIPGIGAGATYKYQIHDKDGVPLPLKADPFGFSSELRPSNASRTADLNQHAFIHEPKNVPHDQPISILEVHLGSWAQDRDGGFLSYDVLADRLIPYAVRMGFTHLELLPVSEHPFDASWGYQPIGLFAPTSRFGAPDGFMRFVDAAHGAGLGVILDWVPAHFPTDAHGLSCFDGTHLFEHADPRQGFHPDWNTLIFNLGRIEVVNYLIANALFWFDIYKIDGLRVDAVASMLYLDYSRKADAWIPNRHGGNENLEAVAFLERLNSIVHEAHPGCLMIAEESTSWPGVSRPVDTGGLGFGYKWNMGWMNDSLGYMAHDPVHRRWHHDEITFGLTYAFSENFVLPLSHDEVVHGKGTILSRMPGDRWQQFANLRAYYGMMWGQPGKKLLFMGQEFAQADEWNAERGLDWHLLDDPSHQGVAQLVTDLNSLYRERPALFAQDCDAGGFEWLEAGDSERSVFAWLRHGQMEQMLVICNMTPEPRAAYRLGLPIPGRWVERLNTDAAAYGGSGDGNFGVVEAGEISRHGKPYSALFTLPPLATLFFEPEG